MNVKYLQDYGKYQKGDIVGSSDDWLTIQELIREGIVTVIKQKKDYPDKMMRNYTNK